MSHALKRNEEEISIRTARPGDARALRRLAQRDSSVVPSGLVLLALVDGDVRAAISLADPAVAIADPFRPTRHLLSLLRIEAANRHLVGQHRPLVGSLRALRTRTALRSAPAWR